MCEGKIDLHGYEIYKYSVYLKTLISTFGSERVNVLPFEYIKSDYSKYCLCLADVFELKSSLVEKTLKVNHINRKVKSSKGYYTKDGEKLIPFFSIGQKKVINDYFREDNKQLQNMMGSQFSFSGGASIMM